MNNQVFKKTKLFMLMALFCFTIFTPAQDKPIPLSDYLEYARQSADYAWDHYDEIIEKWKKSFDPNSIFGYRPPGNILEMAVIYSYLYEKEENSEYAQRAKKVIMSYESYRSLYPQWAIEARTDYDDTVPMLPDFFTAMRYIRAYNTLDRLGQLSADEKKLIEPLLADSMTYLLRSQEWGPMNRAALRAESLAWALKALPDHPEADKWDMQRRAIGDDNWGNWEIEDASLYNAVWLYALCGYADAMGKQKELFKTAEMYYYGQYFLNLISPMGMVTDFGDANWLSNWNRFLVYFETAANHYQDPHLKWAASAIGRKFIDFNDSTNVGLGYMLLDCYRWGSDEIQVEKPDSLSCEVMEDIVGKKIVFRNGWDKNSTFMLLNYRDEGDGGLNYRDYLRDTIPVEEEKMTHGHSDENSIALLMAEGSVLLSDGGYRDFMPSGPFGAYRQDYFHNRLCVRPEKIFMGQERGQFRYSVTDLVPGQSILEFLHNAGSYKIVRTQRVDFIVMDNFDYSRTRLIDEDMGYSWDRIITYIKDPGLFVVFDVFKAQQEGYFTLANLWHTRKIIAQGAHWYDTVYDKIQNSHFPQDHHLLIIFPKTHFRMEGIEPEKRNYQDEFLIHQTTAQHFELGENAGFITVLIPHPKNELPETWVQRVSLVSPQPAGAGLGIRIKLDKKEILLGIKNDLRMDISRDWRRPRYVYESGRIAFDEFESDGDFVMAEFREETAVYTIVNLTKAYFKDKILLDPKSAFFGLNFDASPVQPGVGKLRYWREKIKVNDQK
ncbi:MAG: hypothetical protein JW755_07890 [Candidatus Aminicenantes bacterium]|nr:hypothetical protein [Candidatus Aminicenantes bacterium]